MNDKLLVVKFIVGCIEMLNINDKLFVVNFIVGCIVIYSWVY